MYKRFNQKLIEKMDKYFDKKMIEKNCSNNFTKK